VKHESGRCSSGRVDIPTYMYKSWSPFSPSLLHLPVASGMAIRSVNPEFDPLEVDLFYSFASLLRLLLTSFVYSKRL
jgi:hypothetical protein